jgi:Holliday junction resolvasome RuvABC DNA-binding subunit
MDWSTMNEDTTHEEHEKNAMSAIADMAYAEAQVHATLAVAAATREQTLILDHIRESLRGI